MIIKAPNSYPNDKPTIFLAGSIEMGKAEDWQKVLGAQIVEKFGDRVTVLDPRRDGWDSSWKQEDGDNEFTKQVVWEQNALIFSQIRFFYFAPGTISPISLLELGQFGDVNSVVCCPEGYWRKGNVDIVCRLAGTKVYPTLEEATKQLLWEIEKLLGLLEPGTSVS